MTDDDKKGCFMVTGIIVLIMWVALMFNYIRSSAQAALYRREGIEISTWEVMLGARPAERAITIK